MKYAGSITCLTAVLIALCGCSRISNWLQQRSLVERELPAAGNTSEAHPVGVTYTVASSFVPSKQISIFFDGKGMARVLDAAISKDKKMLVDFTKQEIIRKDFSTGSEEVTKIDPFDFPSVLNAGDAQQAKATSLGTGITRGFPYHRWGLHKNAYECEVWTDDRDSFPIYYRSIKNGDVVTWTVVNSWIDGSICDKPTFFSLQPDPPPPPVTTVQEVEQAASMKRRNQRKRHSNALKRRIHKPSAPAATG